MCFVPLKTHMSSDQSSRDPLMTASKLHQMDVLPPHDQVKLPIRKRTSAVFTAAGKMLLETRREQVNLIGYLAVK